MWPGYEDRFYLTSLWLYSTLPTDSSYYGGLYTGSTWYTMHGCRGYVKLDSTLYTTSLYHASIWFNGVAGYYNAAICMQSNLHNIIMCTMWTITAIGYRKFTEIRCRVQWILLWTKASLSLFPTELGGSNNSRVRQWSACVRLCCVWYPSKKIRQNICVMCFLSIALLFVHAYGGVCYAYVNCGILQLYKLFFKSNIVCI